MVSKSIVVSLNANQTADVTEVEYQGDDIVMLTMDDESETRRLAAEVEDLRQQLRKARLSERELTREVLRGSRASGAIAAASIASRASPTGSTAGAEDRELALRRRCEAQEAQIEALANQLRMARQQAPGGGGGGESLGDGFVPSHALPPRTPQRALPAAAAGPDEDGFSEGEASGALVPASVTMSPAPAMTRQVSFGEFMDMASSAEGMRERIVSLERLVRELRLAQADAEGERERLEGLVASRTLEVRTASEQVAALRRQLEARDAEPPVLGSPPVDAAEAAATQVAAVAEARAKWEAEQAAREQAMRAEWDRTRSDLEVVASRERAAKESAARTLAGLERAVESAEQQMRAAMEDAQKMEARHRAELERVRKDLEARHKTEVESMRAAEAVAERELAAAREEAAARAREAEAAQAMAVDAREGAKEAEERGRQAAKAAAQQADDRVAKVERAAEERLAAVKADAETARAEDQAELRRRVAALREMLAERMERLERERDEARKAATAARARSERLETGLRGVRTEAATLKRDAAAARSAAITNGNRLREETAQAATSILKRVGMRHASLLTRVQWLEGRRRRLENDLHALRGNIRVFCRVRPLAEAEIAAGDVAGIQFPASGQLLLQTGSEERRRTHEYAFDAVFGPHATQEDVFEECEPLVTSVLDGYNGCIFAYGQTGSGKTYTMLGPADNPGITGRTVASVFSLAAQRRHTHTHSIEVSMLEVYNDDLQDLLANYRARAPPGAEAAIAPGLAPPGEVLAPELAPTGQRRAASGRLDVLTGPQGVYVSNLTTVRVFSVGDVNRAFAAGERERATAMTSMNDRSSRSHMVLAITVTAVALKGGDATRATLHLVDLAGSERLQRSKAEGDRRKEAAHINKSLFGLTAVLEALQRKRAHVPYRNVKLTYLLSSALGGDAKAAMIVQVSPTGLSADETVCSLDMGQRAASVEFGAVQRASATGDFLRLKDTREKRDSEVSALREEAARARERVREAEARAREAEARAQTMTDRAREARGAREDGEEAARALSAAIARAENAERETAAMRAAIADREAAIGRLQASSRDSTSGNGGKPGGTRLEEGRRPVSQSLRRDASPGMASGAQMRAMSARRVSATGREGSGSAMNGAGTPRVKAAPRMSNSRRLSAEGSTTAIPTTRASRLRASRNKGELDSSGAPAFGSARPRQVGAASGGAAGSTSRRRQQLEAWRKERERR